MWRLRNAGVLVSGASRRGLRVMVTKDDEAMRPAWPRPDAAGDLCNGVRRHSAAASVEGLQRMKSDERSEPSFVFSWMEKSAIPLPFTSALTMKPLEFSSHCSSPGLPVKLETNVNF